MNGKKVVLNVNNDTTPSFFPKGLRLDSFKTKLTEVLNTYNEELVVIENEELNRYDSGHNKQHLYHYGSMQDYISELKAADSKCKIKNRTLTNGGLTTPNNSSLYK